MYDSVYQSMDRITVLTLKYVVTLLKKYPVQDVIEALEKEIANMEDNDGK